MKRKEINFTEAIAKQKEKLEKLILKKEEQDKKTMFLFFNKILEDEDLFNKLKDNTDNIEVKNKIYNYIKNVMKDVVKAEKSEIIGEENEQ